MTARVMVLADGEPIRNGRTNRVVTWPDRATAESYINDCARMWAPLELTIADAQAAHEEAAA